MKQKFLLAAILLVITGNVVSAQFIVKDENFAANGVSNQGKISGYAAQAGPYGIWLPDSGNVIIDIGGIAPGNGVGGQARLSTDGNFICGTSMGVNGAEMSKYSRSSNQWTTVGSLAFSVDGNVSGGYGISGDGNTVAGNSWADTTGNRAYTHAVAYNSTEGLMDLGSLFDSIARSTRVNAVSYDGSMVVGWQDFNGPWKSAVWRKNPAGGYFPNQYILIDTAGNPFDDYNQMGECSSISADGKWIGGYGDYANNNQPWIWSKDSGVINLGTLPNTGNGYVSGLTADASVVVGWFDAMFFGDPQTPFIWTRTGGLHELNEYIHTVLGDSTDTHQVYTANCISPDGHYIAGYGVDTSTFNYFVYRVSLIPATTGMGEISEKSHVKIYPNPTADLVTIESPKTADLTISSADGKVIYKTEIKGVKSLDMSGYASGVYFICIQCGNSIETGKLVKN
ncbi:MAG: hypothetical protein JWO06_2678 [Bacteroidota bacterium]|nr:hypothetical protein [Bacteroidota bacterium]